MSHRHLSVKGASPELRIAQSAGGATNTSRAWRMDAEDIYSSNSLSLLGLRLQCIDEHEVDIAEV